MNAGSLPHAFATGDLDNRLPNTCNIAFEYIEGEAILLLSVDTKVPQDLIDKISQVRNVKRVQPLSF